MNINKQINGVQYNNLGSLISSSFLELQSFYSDSSPPQESCVHPHLPAILLEEEEEETRHRNVGPTVLSEKNVGKFESRDTLQSLVQSCCCGINLTESQENSTIRSPSGIIQECKHQNNKPIMSNSNCMLSFKKNINEENYDHQYCSKPRQAKEQPVGSFEGTTTLRFGSIKVVSEKETMKKKKTRIRWTNELDKKFIESVNRLGGARKATPKEILKLMKCNGLTIFHVKSHLQKFRSGQLMRQATDQGNAEQLDSKTGVEIVETLRIQMDVQRSLYEQLESQKKLQMRIEEQAKQLQNMIKCHLNTK